MPGINPYSTHNISEGSPLAWVTISYEIKIFLRINEIVILRTHLSIAKYATFIGSGDVT
jgi:hypothetical protein